MTLVWAGFAGMVVVLVLADLFVFNRRRQRMASTSAVGWALIYTLLAFCFNGAVYALYNRHFAGLGLATGTAPAIDGAEASLQFLTSLFLETALGLDSVFVIYAVFRHFRTPERIQRRVLMWGVLIALALRAVMVGATGAMLHRFEWVKFVLSGLMVLSALRMLLVREENLDPARNIVVRLLQRFFPTSSRDRGGRLLTRVDGRLALTPLLVVLLLIETADAFLAVDSIPAAFSVTRDPLLVFAASAFSLLMLRSLYFALVSMTGWLRHLKIGLALLLAYAAVVMSLPQHHDPAIEVTLAVMCSTLCTAAFAAWLLRRPGPVPTTSPLGEDAERIARLTLKQARRIIILVAGLAITITGIVMVPAPGPGLVVIPIGLALLATEFVWARRLLNRYTGYLRAGQKRASNVLLKNPRPWLIAPVMLGTFAAFAAVLTYTTWPTKVLLPFMVGVAIGETLWAVTTVRKAREFRKARDHPPVPATRQPDPPAAIPADSGDAPR